MTAPSGRGVPAPDDGRDLGEALAEARTVLHAMAVHGIRIDDRKFERYMRVFVDEYDRRGEELAGMTAAFKDAANQVFDLSAGMEKQTREIGELRQALARSDRHRDSHAAAAVEARAERAALAAARDRVLEECKSAEQWLDYVRVDELRRLLAFPDRPDTGEAGTGG